MRKRLGTALLAFLVSVLVGDRAHSQQAGSSGDRAERLRQMSREAEERGLAQPFRGVTTDGTVVPGLFTVRSTGVSTGLVRAAAEAFLSALTPGQSKKVSFAVDDPEWRKWMNQRFYTRQGVSFEEMSEPQREAAFALLRASLSAKGLQLSRDIMHLNQTLAELDPAHAGEYGEWRYWITVMGEPSATEPWGWQLDGHHLIVNYFVLGDQVVMSPAFWGSEPATARSGRYAGTSVLQDEQAGGLALVRTLAQDQRRKAIVRVSKTGNDNVGEAFKDNVVLDYAGIRAAELTAPQKRQLLALIGLYVGNLRDGHAQVKMAEVESHLAETCFAWIGGTEPDGRGYGAAAAAATSSSVTP